MSDSAFDPFLAEVARALGRRPEQSAAVTDELRDHLEERLAELLQRGVPRESAVQTAIDELGDAAALAAEFNTVTRDLRRRWIMRYATATVAAAVLVLLVTAAFWPNTPTAPLAPQATAQEAAQPKEPAPKETTAPRPKDDSKEAANARTEQLLASHRVKADIKEMPLQKFFLEYLREVKTEDGKTVELQSFLDYKKLEEAQVEPAAPVTLEMKSIRLDMLLKLVLGSIGLGYYIDDGIIIVTSKDAIDTHMEVRVYNCRDLLELPRMKRPAGSKPAAGAAGPADAAGGAGPGGAVAGLGGFGGGFGGLIGGDGLMRYDVELIDVLRTNVKPDSWSSAGGPGDLSEYRGMLVVTQTPEIHRKIEELLDMLRRSAARESPAGR